MSTLIISGGHVDICCMKRYLRGKYFEHVIAVDAGVKAAEQLAICPDYLVGDFDTLPQEHLEKYEQNPDVMIRRFCAEKDDTDTEIAVELAGTLEQEKKGEVVILGATGTRLDHTLANLLLMERLAEKGISACCVDAYNRISVHMQSFCIKREEQYGDYVSFVALTPTVEGLTLKGFRYPLENRVLHQNVSLCISNEINHEVAGVTFETGILLMVEAKDQIQGEPV